MKIRRALISVSDKTGIIEFVRALRNMGVEILATGGTARLLTDNGLPIKSISDYTGSPEMLDGRVKTLHPRIHGGILFRRDNKQHLAQIEEQGITPIDMVVVNLYPFQETIALPDGRLADAIEQIDIGGPTLIRAAAKNHSDVVVVVDPADYTGLKVELNSHNFELSERTCQRLALKAFRHTATYDAAIANYLATQYEDDPFPSQLFFTYDKTHDLRYGENPHQHAALYSDPLSASNDLARLKQHFGKELSFNNFLDMEGAYNLITEFSDPACVIIKHSNPCGVGLGQNLHDAYEHALETDPVSAFGGIFGFNRPIDGELANQMTKRFLEVIIAPAYTEEAFLHFKSVRNLRIVKIPDWGQKFLKTHDWDIRQIGGGLLIQDRDRYFKPMHECEIVSERPPTAEELKALDFARRVAKHVKSNAIVYARPDRTVGIGAGQMSRVDASKLAIAKAKEMNLSLAGTVMASDGFFPFRDGVDAAAEVGVTAIIQPGGSIRDKEVIAAVNEHKIAMVMTKTRHFRH